LPDWFGNLAFGRGFHVWAYPDVKAPPTPRRRAIVKKALWNVVTNLKIMVLCIVISQVIAIVRILP